MAYVALYRRYRPINFSDVIGQEHVTEILKNQILNNKVSHAYIFSGSRGTGKTSVAKIFSRAINCPNQVNGEPCNECEICKSILENNTTDVIEMDAASNNSVENIRQIKQEVIYATINMKRRVYIIDEAHMLTTSAFNALLKTLEEPPENVIFILATTEQHKIPITILSRCLKFEFNRISKENIKIRLNKVLSDLNVKADDEAVDMIAKLADGALRDGLSILDRCLSEPNEVLTLKQLENIIGLIDNEAIQNITKGILSYDYESSLELIDACIKKGKDLRELISRLTENFLDELLKANDEKLKSRISYIIDKLSKLDNDIRFSNQPAILLKSNIVTLCNKSATNVDNVDNSPNTTDTNNISNFQNIENVELEKLILKIKTLEERLENTNKVSYANSNDTNIMNSNILENTSKAKLTKFKNMDDFKQMIAKSGKLKLFSALVGAEIYLSDDKVNLYTDNSYAYSILKQEENIANISSILSENYGLKNPLIISLKEETNTLKTNKIESHLQNNKIEYTKLD